MSAIPNQRHAFQSCSVLVTGLVLPWFRFGESGCAPGICGLGCLPSTRLIPPGVDAFRLVPRYMLCSQGAKFCGLCFLESCGRSQRQQAVGGPGRMWAERWGEGLGHLVSLARSLRDPWGLAVTLTKDDSSLEDGPLHLSCSLPVLIAALSSCPSQLRGGCSPIGTNLRAPLEPLWLSKLSASNPFIKTPRYSV